MQNDLCSENYKLNAIHDLMLYNIPTFIKEGSEIFQFVNSNINNHNILLLSQANYALFIYNYI